MEKKNFEGNEYLNKLFTSTIGNNVTFESPFGPKQIVYSDFTASGRGLTQVESFISSQVLPFYANVHSSCGYLAEQSEAFRAEAKSIVRRYCDTDENNSIIFTGQGATSSINKLIQLLNLKEYSQFYADLSNLKDVYQKCTQKNIDKDTFEYINAQFIALLKEKFTKLFRVTNFCYSNRWGGFDCVLCRMGFTTESQYNEHEKNEIHVNNVKDFKLKSSSHSSSFIDEIAQKYMHKDLLYSLMEDSELFQPILFISRYEHNSNLLQWRETGAKLLYVSSIEELSKELEKNKNIYIKMGTFTAASNITGKYLDVDAYSILMHEYNGLAFFDYATAAPYVKMDMNKPLSKEYRHALRFGNEELINEKGHLAFKDAIFFSPHKFLGGVNTPGVLIIRQRVVRNLLVPSQPGGGVVLFVTQNTQNYVKNIESREESGTPDIIGGVRIGLSLILREKIDHFSVVERDEIINKKVIDFCRKLPNVHLLTDIEDETLPHIPIYSFLISYRGKLFHPNYISALLNDLFGIQSRPGCSCASLYGQYLLGISEEYLHKLEILTCTGKEIFRPGYSRVNFPFYYPDYVVDYILYAIEFCSKHAYRFLPFYSFKIESGRFYHRNEDEKKKWLNEIKFEKGDIIIPDFFTKEDQEFITEEVLQKLKNKADLFGKDDNMEFMLKNVIGKSQMDLAILFEENEKERWFLVYNDVEDLIHLSNNDKKVLECLNTPIEVDFHFKEYKKSLPSEKEAENAKKTEEKKDNFLLGEMVNLDSETEEKQEEKPSKFMKNKNLFPEVPKKIMKIVGEACKDFDMIKANDRILIGISGGKDSLTLLHALLAIKRKVPFKLDIGAVTVDPQSEDYDPSPLKAYMKSLNVPYFFESDAIMKKAKQNLQNNSICSYCARMKRGIIYNCARREKYNVIALGQHLDDIAESFLMSVFHNGLLRTMKANYTIDAGDLRVIRPLIYCREKLFKDFSINSNLPVIQENCPACFSSPKERQRMKVLLAQQENLFPNLFCSLQKAMIPLMRGVLKDNKESKDDMDI